MKKNETLVKQYELTSTLTDMVMHFYKRDLGISEEILKKDIYKNIFEKLGTFINDVLKSNVNNEISVSDLSTLNLPTKILNN